MIHSLLLYLLFAWMYCVVGCEIRDETVVESRKFTFLYVKDNKFDRDKSSGHAAYNLPERGV